MTIRARDVSAIRVGDLLEQDLRIPPYQRPYSWTPATALQLLDDITDTHMDPVLGSGSYVLGAVILHAHSDQTATSVRRHQLDVVDGQQRLLTLGMILTILESGHAAAVPGKHDNPVSRVRNELHRRIGTASSDARRDLAERGAQRHRHARAAMVHLERERASRRAAQHQIDPGALDEQAVRLFRGRRPSAQALSSHSRPRA